MVTFGSIPSLLLSAYKVLFKLGAGVCVTGQACNDPRMLIQWGLCTWWVPSLLEETSCLSEALKCLPQSKGLGE